MEIGFWPTILDFNEMEKNVFLLSKKYPQTITTTTHRLKKSKNWNYKTKKSMKKKISLHGKYYLPSIVEQNTIEFFKKL